MTGQHIQKQADRKWEYPSHYRLIGLCKLFTNDSYIKRQRGTLHKFLTEEQKNYEKVCKQSTNKQGIQIRSYGMKKNT